MDTKRVIKANALRELGQKIVFNYEDFQGHCDSHLAQTRQQAQQYLDEAHQRIVTLEEQSQKRGFEAGYAKGMKQANEEIQKRAKAQTDAQVKQGLKHGQDILRGLAESMTKAKGEWLMRWEVSALELCVDIAQKIIQSELADRPELSRVMIRELLELSSAEQRLIARVHPDDLAFLQPAENELLEISRLHQTIEFRGDPKLQRGDCIVESDYGVIDGRVQTQLDRFLAELTPQEAPCDPHE